MCSLLAWRFRASEAMPAAQAFRQKSRRMQESFISLEANLQQCPAAASSQDTPRLPSRESCMIPALQTLPKAMGVTTAGPCIHDTGILLAGRVMQGKPNMMLIRAQATFCSSPCCALSPAIGPNVLNRQRHPVVHRKQFDESFSVERG